MVQRIDETFANSRTSMQYPHILIHGSGDALPVALEAIKPGNIPLIIVYKDVTYNVGSISSSARELRKLVSVFPITIYKSADVQYEIRNPVDILEAGLWMV